MESTQKPASVALAMYLLWGAVALGVVKFGLLYGSLSSKDAQTGGIVVGATVLIYVFLILMMSTGKNWARIAFLVLFLLGLVPSAPTLLADFARSPVIGGLALGDIVLQAWALFLVFTNPGKAWFQKSAS